MLVFLVEYSVFQIIQLHHTYMGLLNEYDEIVNLNANPQARNSDKTLGFAVRLLEIYTFRILFVYEHTNSDNSMIAAPPSSQFLCKAVPDICTRHSLNKPKAAEARLLYEEKSFNSLFQPC
jgi:hypothetical protein